MSSQMKLSDLIGHAAVDETGRSLGRVHDVRMRRDGPVLQPSGQPTFRVLGVIVGTGALGRRLGYTESEVNGPWLLKVILQAWARRSRYVEWSRIAGTVGGRVVVRGDASDLPQVPSKEHQENSR
jgi:hypothetical protein